MNRQEYLKQYKRYHYSKTRKVISFPMLMEDYAILQRRADTLDMKPSRLTKEIVLNFLDDTPNTFITPQQEAFIHEYIRISRGIATNINQMAHNTNLREYIDYRILITSLKQYEDGFKALVSKLQIP